MAGFRRPSILSWFLGGSSESHDLHERVALGALKDRVLSASLSRRKKCNYFFREGCHGVRRMASPLQDGLLVGRGYGLSEVPRQPVFGIFSHLRWVFVKRQQIVERVFNKRGSKRGSGQANQLISSAILLKCPLYMGLYRPFWG
jgi:hypothetical protein